MDDQSGSEQPLLSFAIPIYNFGRFIAETVESIEQGAQVLSAGSFEIVILDGGSQDETDQVVASLVERYRNIRYVKNETRGGIDRDLDSVTKLVRGSYIWLFSGDDLVIPGWDRWLIPQLKENPDVVLVPAVHCDLQMHPLRQNPIFRDCPGSDPVRFHLDGADESRTRYLGRMATLEATFSFMSAVVVNREVWEELEPRKDYFGSCWAHCARMMPLLFRPATITYLNNFLIAKRGGNDSFMEDGVVARIGIAVDGWDRIIREYFTDPSQQRKLYDALRRDMPVRWFIYAKLSSRKADEVARINRMAKRLYSVPGLATGTRVYYMLFRMLPANPQLNRLVAPLIALLLWARKKLKYLSSAMKYFCILILAAQK